MKKKDHKISRRKFIGTTATFAVGMSLTAPNLFAANSILEGVKKPNSNINGVQIGVITYSFRSLPDQSAEATLKYVLACGINAIELMGDPAESFAGKPESTVNRRAYFRFVRKKRKGETFTDEESKEFATLKKDYEAYNEAVQEWRATVSMDKFIELRKMYNDAGVHIYAFKPSAFSKNHTDVDINWGMKTAKALGASHVTLEHPSDDAHTKKLGEMAEQHGIRVAYHGHEQQTSTFWDTALEQSAHNALNLDLGHYVAAGNKQPLDIIKNKHADIMSMHVKDRKTPENGKHNVVWGSGDTPISEALQLMRDNSYKFPATIELEYKIPEGSDPIQEVKKCLAYCRKSLK